jgi:hypothetical protein
LVGVVINNNHCTSLHAPLEMKKRGFIENKVMPAIVTQNVEKAAFIPLTHVFQPTLENDGT